MPNRSRLWLRDEHGPERGCSRARGVRRLRDAAKGNAGPVVQGPRNLLAAHLQLRRLAKSTALSQLDAVALHRAFNRTVDSASPAKGPRHVAASFEGMLSRRHRRAPFGRQVSSTTYGSMSWW